MVQINGCSFSVLSGFCRMDPVQLITALGHSTFSSCLCHYLHNTVVKKPQSRLPSANPSIPIAIHRLLALLLSISVSLAQSIVGFKYKTKSKSEVRNAPW